jgi:DNA-binding PadR family transcriptional regulator
MEDYKGLTPDEQILDEMLSRMVDDGIISMTWNEVDGLVYYMTDEQKAGIRVRYQEG